ncbi:cysteine peptidase family C39 domain-containing protein [Chromobacterium vaccinii]|uniref:cysteine peptidase family C39 domain-containing protein n=1 Tax=Chromobacterium vaccinii TaxID=1108595 RepID=UPI001C9319D9|nr:cysteine peptidase family C39 domain-containing protein [Chromobacterium vaccinii]
MTHKMPLLNFWVRSKLPLILQTEASECGLACLAMVAGYWGHTIDLVNMRRRFSVSLKGTTLKSLILMAQGLGLQPRPLKLDLPSIMGLKLPCVLHWGMNHFVVLKKVTRNSILIHDPAVGERRLALTEASKYFTGIALELTPNGQFVKANEKQEFSLLSLMGRVEGLSRSFTQLLLLGLAVQVCI